MNAVTGPGRQAYALLDWANENPAKRVAKAQRDVGKLAGQVREDYGLESAELHEVQDAATVITRLAGALGKKEVG